MESPDITAMDTYTAAALLAWQMEMGADEAMLDAPLNRYDLPEPAPRAPARAMSSYASSDAPAPPRERASAPQIHRAPEGPDPVEAAVSAASKATSLDSLRDLVNGFEQCEPKKGARNFLFGEGNPAARVLILLDAPHREEDASGRLMTGPQGPSPEGILFDKMFQAIGLSRSSDDPARGLYLAPILPWRTPGDREVSAQEMATMQPFLARHVEFINPEIILLIGNGPCAAGLGQPGVTRLRGQWKQAFGKPARALLSPRALMAQPGAKRDAWNDLLEISARLGR